MQKLASNSKTHTEIQGTQKRQIILQKEGSCVIHIPDVKTHYYKAIVIKTEWAVSGLAQ